MDKYTEPDFKNSALITIDVQRDTLDGQPLEIPGTTRALPFIRELLNTYRKYQLPVIHIVRLYKTDGSNADLCRKSLFDKGTPVLTAGSPGAELAEELFGDKIRNDPELLLSGGIQKISDHEVVIYKPRWGAFYKTPLHEYLVKLKVNTLIFCGCNFPNCPRTSIYEASERDFKIVLAEDAISGLYNQGKKEMENIGVLIDTTKNITGMVFDTLEQPH